MNEKCYQIIGITCSTVCLKSTKFLYHCVLDDENRPLQKQEGNEN